MNIEMAYLVGMVLGNGEIQRGTATTTVTIDIPHKTLYTVDKKEIPVYVKASIVDIRSIIEPLIGHSLAVTELPTSTKISFSKNNEEYVIREIIRLINGGKHHSTMRMNPELFHCTTDEKKALLRGIADVTGYIRKSNCAYSNDSGEHRVYIEVPGNWDLVIDIANMLKDIDIPIQNIDFGHPNFRDPNLEDYNKGRVTVWKREHQIKIYANEFLPIGFNIKHKQDGLEKYSEELLRHLSPDRTHRFYWEKSTRHSSKPIHPEENSQFLPEKIRGKHYESWTDLARDLGYGE